MSLEQNAERLAIAMERNNSLMELILKKSEGLGGASAATTSADTKAKPEAKAGRKTKAEKEAAKEEGSEVQSFITEIKNWMFEFGAPTTGYNDEAAEKGMLGESATRHHTLKKAMVKLSLKQLKDLPDDPENATFIKLRDWFEKKVKVVDKGFGVGRLSEHEVDPVDDADDEGESELDI